MCDTIVALSAATAGGQTLFGKNSDRQRNEAQAVTFTPARRSSTDSLKCTYLAIPEARQTHTALICRPFWGWGAEMGVNARGVVIGNEGVQARSEASTMEALTGMDLVRLGLERAADADEALDVITDLLARYGQGGNCGHVSEAYYNNSFLVADSHRAYVLETIDRDWLVREVNATHAISNAYSIATPTRTSGALERRIRNNGWHTGDGPIDYAEALADPARQHIGRADERQRRATDLLERRAGVLEISDVMAILRDHGERAPDEDEWTPYLDTRYGACIHAKENKAGGQTTASLVAELVSDGAVAWVTGTAAPCISIFKPVFLDAPPPAQGPALKDRFDPAAPWWRHELMHRLALVGDFARFLADISEERDALEADFALRAHLARSGSSIDRAHIVATCWEEAEDLERRWTERLGEADERVPETYRQAWHDMNELAGLDLRQQNLAPFPINHERNAI